MSSQVARSDGPSPASANTTASSVSDYVQRHHIHLLLDKMVKDLLTEKPSDSDAWMLRWFLEQHRQACARKHQEDSPMFQRYQSGGADSGDAPQRSDSPTLPAPQF